MPEKMTSSDSVRGQGAREVRQQVMALEDRVPEKILDLFFRYQRRRTGCQRPLILASKVRVSGKMLDLSD